MALEHGGGDRCLFGSSHGLPCRWMHHWLIADTNHDPVVTGHAGPRHGDAQRRSLPLRPVVVLEQRHRARQMPVEIHRTADHDGLVETGSYGMIHRPRHKGASSDGGHKLVLVPGKSRACSSGQYNSGNRHAHSVPALEVRHTDAVSGDDSNIDEGSTTDGGIPQDALDAFFARSGLGVDMLLCDSAQSVNGKLYILGGGLSVIGPKPQPLAIALRIEVPWERANIRHEWSVQLLDEDSRPFAVGEKQIVVKGNFEAGRPAGLRPGTPLGVALAINITALPLPGGSSYTFALKINEEQRPEWRVGFFVRPRPQQ